MVLVENVRAPKSVLSGEPDNQLNEIPDSNCEPDYKENDHYVDEQFCKGRNETKLQFDLVTEVFLSA